MRRFARSLAGKPHANACNEYPSFYYGGGILNVPRAQRACNEKARIAEFIIGQPGDRIFRVGEKRFFFCFPRALGAAEWSG